MCEALLGWVWGYNTVYCTFIYVAGDQCNLEVLGWAGYCGDCDSIIGGVVFNIYRSEVSMKEYKANLEGLKELIRDVDLLTGGFKGRKEKSLENFVQDEKAYQELISLLLRLVEISKESTECALVCPVEQTEGMMNQAMDVYNMRVKP